MTIPVSVTRSTDDSRPTELFSSRKIAELALQLINAYSVNDTAPDPVELDRALEWMELNIGQLAGTQSCWWLMRFDITFALEANKADYNLLEAFEASVPGQGVLFPMAAYLISTADDGTTTETEIELVRSHNWLAESDKDGSGTPEKIFIDRLLVMTARPWPIPTDATYSIRLVVQTYAKSVLAKEGEQAGDSAHGFSQEWQRWLAHVTAADIGNGPVRKLERSEVNDLRAIANDARSQLQFFSNREKRSGMTRTEAWGA